MSGLNIDKSDRKKDKKEAKKRASYITKLMLEGRYEEMEMEIRKTSTNKNNQKMDKSKKSYCKNLKEMSKADFCYADQFPYRHSPTAEGNRPRNEILGGSGSNMYRKR